MKLSNIEDEDHEGGRRRDAANLQVRMFLLHIFDFVNLFGNNGNLYSRTQVGGSCFKEDVNERKGFAEV